MPTAVAKKLGIDLSSRKEGELFKWFLACLLFGKPIQQEIAERAYFRLVSAGLRDPDAVISAGWDRLVELLDEAHYVRYDFSTATKLLEVCQELKQRYGSMTKVIAQTRSGSELSARLQEFKHIGPVTARIFTGEVAPIWCGREVGGALGCSPANPLTRRLASTKPDTNRRGSAADYSARRMA